MDETDIKTIHIDKCFKFPTSFKIRFNFTKQREEEMLHWDKNWRIYFLRAGISKQSSAYT